MAIEQEMMEALIEEGFCKRIEAGSEITDHELKRIRSIVEDERQRFYRQQIPAPHTSQLIADFMLLNIEFQILKDMFFSEGSPFAELTSIHAFAVMTRFNEWLAEANKAVRQSQILHGVPGVPR
jgi:hypothetical protein